MRAVRSNLLDVKFGLCVGLGTHHVKTTIQSNQSWTLLSTDAAALRVFERKVLRKILGPKRVGDDFRILFNSELYELLNDMDVLQRLRWLGHVVRMKENAPTRRVFDAGICGSRRRGRPCIRWKDQIEEALSSIGVTNWRKRAKSRGAWKDVLRQAKSVNRVVMDN